MADSPLSEPARSLPDRLAAWRDVLPELTWPRIAGAAGVVVGVVGAVWFLTREPPAPPLVLPRAAPEASTAVSSSGPSIGGTPATITVHAAGAVARPGIYALPAAARVADLVAAAGGAAPEADLDQVNLAAKVADAERVYLPRKGEPPPPAEGAAAGGQPAGPLDLNTATPDQLDALPGVGPATAQAILQFRSRNGRFRSVDDLLDVRGIGPAKLEVLRPLVKV